MAVGGPLHGLTALIGSVLILGAIAIVGIMVLTASSARDVGSGAGRILRPVWAATSRSFRGLFADPNSDVIDLRDEPAPAPEPEAEATVALEPEPKPKKSRKKATAEPVREQEQQALPMDPGDWTLPPLSMLARSDKQEVDAAGGGGTGPSAPGHPRPVPASRPPCSSPSSAPRSPATCWSSVRG